MVSIGLISNDVYLGIGIFMIMLTAGLIAARSYVSIRQYKRLLVDDWLSFLGFAIVVAFFAFNEFQYKRFFMPADLGYMINAGLAVPIMAALSLWVSKAPVLFVYLRLFGIKRWMRYACYTVLVVSGAGFIASFIPALVQCRPLDTPHLVYKWKRCGKANINAGVIAGSVSVAADLCILLLPLRPIFSLHLSKRRKFGLGIVFCSGIFGVLASVLSLVYKIHLFLGARGDFGSILTTMLLQFVECAIALMVGCVPAIRGFWKGYVEPSKIYSSIGSLGNRLLASFSTRTSTRSNKPESAYHDYEMDRFGSTAAVNLRRADDAYSMMESGRANKRGVPA